MANLERNQEKAGAGRAAVLVESSPIARAARAVSSRLSALASSGIGSQKKRASGCKHYQWHGVIQRFGVAAQTMQTRFTLFNACFV